MKKTFLLLAAVIGLASFNAHADGYDLANKSIGELPVYAAAPASGDYVVMFDASANRAVKIDATNRVFATGDFTTLKIGTVTQPVMRAFSDAVASGQTSKTVTATGVTASSKCTASAAEVGTNAVYIRAVVPGTDQVVVTVSGDPGASNLDISVLCAN